MTANCLECAKGQLVEMIADEAFVYNGVRLVARGVEYSHCPECNEDVVTYEQAKRNDVRFADARREHDGLLTSTEIKAVRLRWNLTQHQAGSVFGGGLNAFSKYERGEVTQSKSMDLLIRGSDRLEGLRAFLSELSGVPFGAEWQSDASELVSEGSQPTLAVRPKADVLLLRIADRLDQCANNDAWHTTEGQEVFANYG